ncbi:hypothetical protein EV667_0232 [Ancylobacter aquaticus]|uniref:Uncharacterized protein n=1 Tax=Ancylobacter aquaticus TaxID=100 RepID=A0A4R1I8J6_ANCAQ|nr:hypothetical protein [Ancylobacter aquaticus]TCK30145.1 hypothetical protein EV667_0232 [Ancylobacter aquaticus]
MNQRPEPTTFIAITPTMRQLIENVVEDLMLLLDEIDGDVDCEDEAPRFAAGDTPAP